MAPMATMPVSLMNSNKNYQSCIDACSKCAQICEECMALCLEAEDVNKRTTMIKELADCAQVCATAVSYMSRRSHHSEDICTACAIICDHCASECEKFSDNHCQQCASTCRSCAEECKSMGNGM
jgi:hypothetical protein